MWRATSASTTCDDERRENGNETVTVRGQRKKQRPQARELEVQPDADDGVTLTFHRPGGEATVEIGQRREGATTRMGAIAVLVLAALAGGWFARRNSK